jgi:hypothetical protein
LLSAVVAAIASSEYATKYNTKSDNTDVNASLLRVAEVLDDNNRSTPSVAAGVLRKVLHAINRTISYPLVMSASYLLGHGDHWFPMRTHKFDWGLFQRDLLDTSTLYDLDDVDHTLTRADEDAVDDDEAAQVRVQMINDLTSYKYRDESLESWSPYELSIAFDCVVRGTITVAEGFPGGYKYGHSLRVNSAREPAQSIPQFFREPPAQPTDDAPSHLREEYAAFALGVFYPYDKPSYMAKLGDKSSSLWDKYKTWRERCPRDKVLPTDEQPPLATDSPQRDKFAFRVLDNLRDRTIARAEMKMDTKRVRAIRRLVRTANGGNEDSDFDVSDGFNW